MKKILVVPTIKKDSFLAFKKAWEGIGDWDEVIIVEDQPEKTFEIKDQNYSHYSWKEIAETLGENVWSFISKRDSAIRSFGFYMAWKNGGNYTLTLDDDCAPDSKEPIFNQHIEIMNNFTKWTPSVPGMRTRGLPYRNFGKLPVVLNMGLWSKVPDLDGIQGLTSPIDDFIPPKGNRILAYGQYTPICGMNVCFKSEITPLMYFPLMGEGQPYRRFDDIWAFVMLKKISDHLKYSISVGEPSISHERASNPFDNLIRESNGIKTNEIFWQMIDETPLTGKDMTACVVEIGSALEAVNDPYFSKLGKAIKMWINLFK